MWNKGFIQKEQRFYRVPDTGCGRRGPATEGRPGKQGCEAPGRRGRQRLSHKDSGKSCQAGQRNEVLFF